MRKPFARLKIIPVEENRGHMSEVPFFDCWINQRCPTSHSLEITVFSDLCK